MADKQEQSGLSDHDILMEIREDVKRILGKKPDRTEVYGVMGFLITTAVGLWAVL